METAEPARVVVPNPGPPKVIGILNIVFASLLLVMALFQGVMLLFMPFVGNFMKASFEQGKAKAAAEHRQRVSEQVAELDRLIAEAQDETEKAQLQVEKTKVQNSPPPFMPNTMAGMDMANDPKVRAFNWIDLVTSLALNIPMLISGIWLVRLRESGRRLALWVQGLKALRVLLLLVASAMVVAPTVTRQLDTMFTQLGQDIARSQPGRAVQVQQQMRQTARIMGVFMTVFYVGFYGSCFLYPAVSLWVLTRPGARAACRIASEPPLEPDVVT